MNWKMSAVRWLLNGLQHVSQPSVYPWVFRNIRRLFHGDPESYWQLIQSNAEKTDWFGPFFAGHEAHVVYAHFPDRVLELIEELSTSEKEIIREGAAHSWSELLRMDFDNTFSILKEMQQSNQFELRYSAALGPVRFFDQHAGEAQKETICSFWKEYKNDSRQGLWNLVRQQILEPRCNSVQAQ